eukprot:scaffold279412_cov23-Tisochrysis_lutea.AAC.2
MSACTLCCALMAVHTSAEARNHIRVCLDARQRLHPSVNMTHDAPWGGLQPCRVPLPVLRVANGMILVEPCQPVQQRVVQKKGSWTGAGGLQVCLV